MVITFGGGGMRWVEWVFIVLSGEFCSFLVRKHGGELFLFFHFSFLLRNFPWRGDSLYKFVFCRSHALTADLHHTDVSERKFGWYG